MRLLIIGTLGGQIGAASKIAVARGAKVAQADTVENGLRVMRSGQGVDLVMIDVHMDVDDLIAAMTAERLHYPVIACGIETDSAAAVAAIKAVTAIDILNSNHRINKVNFIHAVLNSG